MVHRFKKLQFRKLQFLEFVLIVSFRFLIGAFRSHCYLQFHELASSEWVDYYCDERCVLFSGRASSRFSVIWKLLMDHPHLEISAVV